MTDDEAFAALVGAAMEWANRMDQWQKFKFPTKYGPIYVDVLRSTLWPQSYDEVGDEIYDILGIPEEASDD